MLGCKSEQKDLRILWKDEKATSIEIPGSLLPDVLSDSTLSYVSVRLMNAPDTTPILGILKHTENIEFTPIIPFTRGLRYEVFFKSEKIEDFIIPNADNADAPQLVAIYPNTDTLPENLLKIYLAFSHSMREGQSEKYIQLIKNGKDTLHAVFLNLQPELWNNEGTVLTVWLDPGRIKRELQPNLLLGSPLTEKAKYQLVISNQWPDKQGRMLQKAFTKNFWVGKRDGISPIVENWKLQLPKVFSKAALQINVLEPLDHYLLMDCLHVLNKESKIVNGTFTKENDQLINFLPAEPWEKKEYVLEIESRLEDLAGNNLNRLFDRDITQPKKSIPKNSYRIPFQIK